MVAIKPLRKTGLALKFSALNILGYAAGWVLAGALVFYFDLFG